MKRRNGKQTRTAPPPSNGDAPWLTVVGARHNNLRGMDVGFPLGRFVCVTGVSGSGKSSLVNDIVYPVLARELNGAEKVEPGEHRRIDGLEHLDKVIDIDQSPIGRTPRSNPATYIKMFDEIRDLYARLPDAKLRGYRPGRFSFNVHTGAKGGGRCDACEGNGATRMDMDFLADLWVPCPVCGGLRFCHETLQIRYKSKSIADVLNMDVDEASAHFGNVPRIRHMVETLQRVGLGYIKLGQSSTTLSGGEAQRIKLARELVKRSTGRTMYLLDEPTTGLHFHDIKKLLAVLHGFVDAGNTVVVIEHNLDVIKTADWIIDLGPEGGADGGRIVSEGTPEHVARSKRSHTGAVLREVLDPTARKAARSGRRTAAGRGRPNGSTDVIRVVGARQHNLKNIDVDVPRGKMTVCCGPSGSGKTSFAIDTVYTEGQRRYVESLSAYARQFLGRLQPPRVDHVYGLAPAIAIEQKTTGTTSRSTVGTVTEIHDYLRVLWARLGIAHCPTCKVPIGAQSSEEIVDKVMGLAAHTKVLLLAPIQRSGQETYERLFARQRANGFARAYVDGDVFELDSDIPIDAKRDHIVALVVDRVVIRPASRSRITDSVEQALAIGGGVLWVDVLSEARGGKKDGGARASRGGRSGLIRYSKHHACDQCGQSYEELSPHHFSFNSRLGWCPSCEGLGTQPGAGTRAIVVHPTRSILAGAMAGMEDIRPGSLLHRLVVTLADRIGFDPSHPFNSLPEPLRAAFLHGSDADWIELGHPQSPDSAAAPDKKMPERLDLRGVRIRWRGFIPAINRATRSSWQFRKRLEDLITDVPCEVCGGGRLRPETAAVRVKGRTLHDVCSLPLSSALAWFRSIKLDARDRAMAGELCAEIVSRLRFLVDVGLDYITLYRAAATLSGGESQRIRLAAQLGTGLTGVLYVLDEPTIGLHPRDNTRLIAALHGLRDLGNTLLVIEHDRDVLDSADHVLDFGPGAGRHGGTVTAFGSPAEVRANPASLTGAYLSFDKAIPVPARRREVGDRWLTVHGARENNLKEIDVAFPVGVFTCVTGVSGSGKSSLVTEILYNALACKLHRARLVVGGHERIEGIHHLDKVISVDQSPIGNTPTSNPATYTGVFEPIRKLYARVPMSKVRGYLPGRFSFMRPGGRCEACSGMGQRCVEMHFLPDVWVTCEHCKGRRYGPETLKVLYHGKSIADVLEMNVADALALFEHVPKIRRMLQTLDDVGLGYLTLGQSASTLSGGEAQRVKLASELGRPATGKTLYILDEPTTGLHFDDLARLLTVLHRLVDRGNTCVCIEHNLDLIKTADWVIDLGPEAGDKGGHVVVAGTPEQVADTAGSHTGVCLRPVLSSSPIQKRAAKSASAKAASAEAAPDGSATKQAKTDLDRILKKMRKVRTA